MTNARRLLLVHAHPDDETISTGATMGRYAAEGAEVSLITCTLGEAGEILVPELAELEWDKGDQLGGYRMGELAAALRALGVTRHFFLGGAGRFRDSGMTGTPANRGPRAFWRASTEPAVFAAAVGAAVDIIRSVRPQVIVTYDPDGGYGHPDHIMAHRIATAAMSAAADAGYDAPGDPWAASKFYWTATPRSVLMRDIGAMQAADRPASLAVPSVDDFPFLVEDSAVTTAIDARGFVPAKTAALRAHATQICVAGQFYALSNRIGRPIRGIEHYRLVHGAPAGARDADGRETDLFAGVS